MLRWCLSTVRTLGGHDTNPRLCRLFSPQASRISRSRFISAYVEPPIPLASVVEEPDSLTAPLSAQSLPIALRDTRGPARSSTSYSSINTLRQFLSPENFTSDCPLVYSPTAIRSFYYRAESRNQLDMLDSRMFTLLIALFGSLSIDPSISVAYRDPLICRNLRVSTRRTHWAFVLKVGRRKLESGMLLYDSDRFWLMRAELATAQVKPPLECLSGDAYRAVLRARMHYHIIRRHSRHPEVHAHYLETLLAIRDSRFLHFAACDLSFLIRKHDLLHPRLQCLLYRLAIEYGGVLSTRSQEVILAALWSRSSHGTSGTSNNCMLDATIMARSLSTTLFTTVGSPPNNNSANLFGHLFSVFSPAYALPLRWNSLVMLAIFNSSDILHLTGSPWTSDQTVPQVTSCWQVIFGLATVGKIMSAPVMQPLPTEGVLETTRTLYQLWLPVMKSRSVPRDIACAVTTSFLRIASVLADETLLYDCQELYNVEHSSDAPQIPAISTSGHLAAQYIATAVRVQGPHLDVVRRALEVFSLDLQQQHQVLASAVEALAPIDSSLAYALLTVAQEMGMEFDLGATHALAISFARHGAFCKAIRLLKNDRFSLEKRGILVSVIARSLRENPRTLHPSSDFSAIVDELAVLYHRNVPPEHFRGHFEQLLVVLAHHGRGRQLSTVLRSICTRSPDFFQARFFVRYWHVLVRHRQFSTASKLLGAIIATHPKTARFLSLRTDRMVMQTKALRSSKRTTPLRGPMSLSLSPRPYAGLPPEISLQELLKSGRVLAAKRIFTCAAATISSRRCTTLGNILLHGVSRQPTARNGRRVRKVLALLENLVNDHSFRPDRVTANILVRVMIKWRSAFDSSRLRKLFDQLVVGGYPAANYSPSHPPFNTQWTRFSDSSDFSKLPPFVSFEKHTRPLFKMFIKAFYLCNDTEAARKVVGILKVEENKNTVAKEARQRARSRGRIRAGQRNMTPLDTTSAAPSIE